MINSIQASRLADSEQHLFAEILEIEPKIATHIGQALTVENVKQTVKRVMALDHLDEEQWNHLLITGSVGRILLKLGYVLESQLIQGSQCSPPQPQEWLSVFVSQPDVSLNQNSHVLNLADGFPIHNPILVVADGQLIILQILGAPEAVNANWAALVGGGKSHWIKGVMVRLGGMKQYVRLKSVLPCGWSETWLIHHQASVAKMIPEQPFYLIDDGLSVLTDKFYWMCDKALSIPLQESWAEFLWLAGRQRGLVTLVDPDHCHGITAWQVNPDLELWQEIVSSALHQQLISF